MTVFKTKLIVNNSRQDHLNQKYARGHSYIILFLLLSSSTLTRSGDVQSEGKKLLLLGDQIDSDVNLLTNHLYISGIKTDTLNINSSVILNELLVYDVVLVFTGFGTSRVLLAELGDVLADYIDQGGRLIITSFMFDTSQPTLAIAGRLLSDGYLPYNMSTLAYDMNSYSGESLHPAVANVTSYSTRFTHNEIELSLGSRLLVSYNEGPPMLTIKENIMGLNGYLFSGASGDISTLVSSMIDYFVPPPIIESLNFNQKIIEILLGILFLFLLFIFTLRKRNTKPKNNQLI